MTICVPNSSEFDSVKVHLSEFELDDREIKKEQFLIVKKDDTLVAFCRMRKHKGCDELCSLGVIPSNRGNGYAKLLLRELISRSDQPLYLACIIPQFFEPLGFQTTNEYPVELSDKLNYCSSELMVPEKYVVMRYIK